MPHYEDGTEAKVGDLVFGKSHSSGSEPVAGYVVSITPGAGSCNMHIATLRPCAYNVNGVLLSAGAGSSSGERYNFTDSVEIANCDAFRLLHRKAEATPHGSPEPIAAATT